jgi:GR25 family glycosyltransferase involved in LPS biosynthesis
MLKSAVMTPSLLEQTDTGSTINVEIQKNHVTREALFLEKPKRADPSSIKNSESSFKLGRIPIQLSRFGYSCIAIFIQKIAFKFDPKPARFLCLQYLIAIKNVKTKNTNGIREFPVYVINRSCDHDRLNSFSARSKKWGVYYELVEGVDLRETINPLRRYQNRIANTCYASQNFIKGIYGCFLGHRRAWQKIVNSGVEWALVCEDDARFLGPLPLKIRDFGIPSDAEIVFCNLRMAEGFLGDVLLMGSNNGKIFSPIKVEEALDALLDFRQAFNAPGGDGYLLSNIGARKLLSNFEESQMAFDVDWFMLFNSIGDKSMEDFLYRDRTGRFDGFQLPSTRLNGYVLFPSLVEQAEGESKVMRREFCTREELFS